MPGNRTIEFIGYGMLDHLLHLPVVTIESFLSDGAIGWGLERPTQKAQG
jgi:hypothetical protein